MEMFEIKDTIIYLIRHAETINETGIRNTDENLQEINEKEILSIKGEQDSKLISENNELKNIDMLWCSSYTRAKQTAKYIANQNNLQYNSDKRLCERKLGNIEDLAKLMKDKSSRPEIVNDDANVAQYDTIFLGFPIWWYIAPTIVNTFLEKYHYIYSLFYIFYYLFFSILLIHC